MGFSVSGSFAILVLASFIAFGVLHSAGANSFERVTDATHDVDERDLDQRNTAISITNVSYQSNELNVTATNNGTTALSVDGTDLIVDNVYQQATHPNVTVEVVGSPDSNLWLPGQTLSFHVQSIDYPNRIKVVTEHGVSDAQEVA